MVVWHTAKKLFSMMFRNLNTEHPANLLLGAVNVTNLTFKKSDTTTTGEDSKPDPLDTLVNLITWNYRAEG